MIMATRNASGSKLGGTHVGHLNRLWDDRSKLRAALSEARNESTTTLKAIDEIERQTSSGNTGTGALAEARRVYDQARERQFKIADDMAGCDMAIHRVERRVSQAKARLGEDRVRKLARSYVADVKEFAGLLVRISQVNDQMLAAELEILDQCRNHPPREFSVPQIQSWPQLSAGRRGRVLGFLAAVASQMPEALPAAASKILRPAQPLEAERTRRLSVSVREQAPECESDNWEPWTR